MTLYQIINTISIFLIIGGLILYINIKFGRLRRYVDNELSHIERDIDRLENAEHDIIDGMESLERVRTLMDKRSGILRSFEE